MSILHEDGRSFPIKPLGLEQKWWILIAVGIGTFMSAVDSSITNIILPVLQGYYHTDTSSVEWVVTVYLLAVSGLLLSVGRLGDIRSHKNTFILGFAVFTMGSVLCGFSPTIGAQIGFRVIQAVGAAMLLANGPAILTGNFPAEQRGQALGLQSTMTYIGLMVGPSLGGFLADHIGWRAVYYVNVPFGLLAILLSLRFIPRENHTSNTERFDILGALTFMAGLSTLLAALNQGDAWGWGSRVILGMMAVAIILLALFIWIEAHRPSPMLDLSLFHNWLFSASAGSAVINYICMYSLTFVMPFYLMDGRGLSPTTAGLFLTIQPFLMAITAPISGTLSDRIGSRLLSTVGMGIIWVGLLLLASLNVIDPTAQLLLYLAIIGLGIGIFIVPNTNALMGSAPRNRQGIASGILATARNVGMVLGVGISGAVFTSIRTQNLLNGPSQAVIIGSHASFLVAAVIAGIGMLISASRGKKTGSDQFEQAPDPNSRAD